MRKQLRIRLLMVTLATVSVAGLLAPEPARAMPFTLVGEDITVTLSDPTVLLLAVNDPVTVVDPAIEINPGDGSEIGAIMLPNEFIDFLVSSIVIHLEEGLPGGATGFGAGSSYTFSNIGLGGVPFSIDDVQIASLDNIMGFTLEDDILFDDHSITVFIDTLVIGEIDGIDTGTITLELIPIPEPGSGCLLGLGLATLAGGRRRAREARRCSTP